MTPFPDSAILRLGRSVRGDFVVAVLRRTDVRRVALTAEVSPRLGGGLDWRLTVLGVVKVFLDESGNGNPEMPLVVCGVAVEESLVEALQDRIRSAYQRTLARPSFRSQEDRERFEKEGFHRSLDLPEIGIEFAHLLSSTSVYKAFLIGTDRTTLSGTETDQIVELYVRLGGVLRRKFRRAAQVDLIIERNTALRPRMDEIRERINSRRASNGCRLPLVTVQQQDKSPDSVLAASDGLALIAASWLKSNRPTDHGSHLYRTYIETEAAISWFCSLEHGVLSTRRARHDEITSASTGAESVSRASPHASVHEHLLSTRSRAPQSLPKDLVTDVERFAAALHVDIGALYDLADHIDAGDYFETKRIRTGKRTRTVVVPHPYYETVVKQLARILAGTTNYVPAPHVFGFVKGRGIGDNARVHLSQECVLRLDLREFFESIDRERVEEVLRADGVAQAVASIVARLATPEGHLATGLSTSPHLSNLAFAATDRKLVDLASELGLAMTRYVDDLIFSGAVDDGAADRVREALLQQGWHVNERKTRFMRRGHSQYVTGLSVSDRESPHVPRRLKRQMRWRLHIIEKFGYDAYMSEFDGATQGHYPSHLRGMAMFVVGHEPGIGPDYLRRWAEALPESWYPDGEEVDYYPEDESDYESDFEDDYDD